MKISKNLVLLPIALLALSGCGKNDKDTTKYFRVTWKNYDGTVLEVDKKVKEGSTPKYDGTTPEKASTEALVYNFSGWSPKVVKVSKDATYTAQFSDSPRPYTITWKDDNGDILKSEQVPYGTVPSYGSDPEKAEDDGYTYAFDAWNPEPVSVVGDAEYQATYTSTKKQYTVLFKNYDGTVLGSVNKYYDDLMSKALNPVAEDPTRPNDGNFHYKFIGWDRDYTNVKPNTLVYTASYLEFEFSTDHYYVNSLTTNFFEHELTIPSMFNGYPVTQILHDSFKNKRIDSVVIESGITYIGENAFLGAEIGSVNIPGSVGVVDTHAFANTPKLHEVIFHEGTTQVRQEAFMNSGIRTLELPASLTDVGYQAFAFCGELYKVTMKAPAFSGYDTTYHYGIFEDCGALTEVLQPNATNETAYSFGYDRPYIAILIGSEVSKAGEFSFTEVNEETNEVAKIYYKEFGSTNKILVGCFSDDMTTRILHADGTERIKKFAFVGNHDLDEIYIPSDITYIESEAFRGNTKTTKVEFEEGEQYLTISSDVFKGLTNLTSIDMSPRKISYVSSYCFAHCEKLESAIMSSETSSIGGYAFAWTKLVHVTIPKKVTSIDADAFNDALSIEDFSVESGSDYFTSADGILFSKDEKSLYSFPTAKACPNNTYVIPEGTNRIVCRAFQHGVLTHIVLPSSLTNFGQFALDNMTNLEEVRYNGTKAQYEAIPSIHSQAVYRCSVDHVTCSDLPSTMGVQTA